MDTMEEAGPPGPAWEHPSLLLPLSLPVAVNTTPSGLIGVGRCQCKCVRTYNGSPKGTRRIIIRCPRSGDLRLGAEIALRSTQLHRRSQGRRNEPSTRNPLGSKRAIRNAFRAGFLLNRNLGLGLQRRQGPHSSPGDPDRRSGVVTSGAYCRHNAGSSGPGSQFGGLPGVLFDKPTTQARHRLARQAPRTLGHEGGELWLAVI